MSDSLQPDELQLASSLVGSFFFASPPLTFKDHCEKYDFDKTVIDSFFNLHLASNWTQCHFHLSSSATGQMNISQFVINRAEEIGSAIV